MRVFLTGFMGAGKTTVGRHLARGLDWRFVDLDTEIEKTVGLGVREIFAQRGEAGFRRYESERLASILAEDNVVVATGGGTVSLEANRKMMERAGVSVWLNPPFDEIVSRIGGQGKADRPLFPDEVSAFELYRERLASYRSADLRIDVARGESAAETAARIILRLRETMR
ncbi:MAG TPA: shikimate kinase, partial [Thermoanaerobaculia bacterium]|nr:shikimate kinase [Thermoanaerobaculia bacterium]